MNKIVQRSLLNAFGTVAYVAIIATVMQNGEKIFNNMNQATAPIAFLTMFVLSAAITGSLVLGKPALLYFDNQKAAAIKMFVYTLVWLAFMLAILLTISILMK